MNAINNNINDGKFKQLTCEDRVKIETLLKTKHSNREIALIINKSVRTLEREKKKGVVALRNNNLSYRIKLYIYCTDKS